MYQKNELHWNEYKIILQYVQGTKNFSVHYSTSASLPLDWFCDLDCDGDPTDKKSTSCFVFILAKGPIFQSSKKQKTISLSLAEAEYREAINAATQCVWLQGILWEFGVTIDSPTNIWVENKSAIKISTDPLEEQDKSHRDTHALHSGLSA